MSTILTPQIIHLIGPDKVPPPQYVLLVDRISAFHPDWEIIIWDDISALSIVVKHFPELVSMYNSYTVPVQRCDIFRILIIYLYGGFYLDMDMFCLKSLDELCSCELVLGVEKTLSPVESAKLGHRHSLRIANYMFGSMPRHGFWLDVIKEAGKRVGNEVELESDILETTGPGLLTDVFHEAKHRYNNLTLLPNNKACQKLCGPASCHFGDFAAHLHLGSWRWVNQ